MLEQHPLTFLTHTSTHTHTHRTKQNNVRYPLLSTLNGLVSGLYEDVVNFRIHNCSVFKRADKLMRWKAGALVVVSLVKHQLLWFEVIMFWQGWTHTRTFCKRLAVISSSDRSDEGRTHCTPAPHRLINFEIWPVPAWQIYRDKG